MSMAESRRQLGVNGKDVAVIRSRKDPDRLFLALLGAATGVIAFMVGFMISRENPGYPYSSIGLAAVAGVGKRRSSWVAALMLALIALFFVNFGVFAARPTMGEGSFYGVFSRKK